MVGRLGSSAGVLPVDVDAVVSLRDGVLSGVWRFMVGRSGSSAGVEPVSAGVLDVVVDVPEPEASGLRRFMVGRLGSSLVEGLVVLEVVVSGLVWSGLVWSLPLEEAVSVGLEPKWGRFGSAEAVMTGRFFDGLRAVVVLRGAERGLTLP
jgi:hypothetical protein